MGASLSGEHTQHSEHWGQGLAVGTEWGIIHGGITQLPFLSSFLSFILIYFFLLFSLVITHYFWHLSELLSEWSYYEEKQQRSTPGILSLVLALPCISCVALAKSPASSQDISPHLEAFLQEAQVRLWK